MAIPLFAAAIANGGGMASGLNVAPDGFSWIGNAGMIFETNGGISYVSSSSEILTDYWFIGEPVTGIGSNISIRMVKVSGTDLGLVGYGGLSQGTWYALTSNREFGLAVSGATISWTGYVEYSFDGGSTVARTSSNFTIEAQLI